MPDATRRAKTLDVARTGDGPSGIIGSDGTGLVLNVPRPAPERDELQEGSSVNPLSGLPNPETVPLRLRRLLSFS